MSAARKIVRYQLRDIARNRWVLAYAAVLLVLTEAFYRLGGDGARALLSLLNVVLILVPLVALTFGTLYLYHAREFIELVLAQPVGRGAMFAGLYIGLALPLAGGLAGGVGLPFLFHLADGPLPWRPLLVLLGTGVLLTLAFTAIAFVIALRFEDRAKGFGTALLVWLACAVVYDGLVLLVTVTFADYPLETPLLLLTLLNPLDLGRVLLLLHFEVAALMGYTGAVFQRFLGTALGMALAVAALLAWTGVPLALGARRFQRRDL
ncbi:MAG TPA: ABC transporter permease subunit [Gemmatimonadales bacterium]|nr:ABC transporter permease subunit [Gemmatimonadales bacterium]